VSHEPAQLGTRSKSDSVCRTAFVIRSHEPDLDEFVRQQGRIYRLDDLIGDATLPYLNNLLERMRATPKPGALKTFQPGGVLRIC